MTNFKDVIKKTTKTIRFVKKCKLINKFVFGKLQFSFLLKLITNSTSKNW